MYDTTYGLRTRVYTLNRIRLDYESAHSNRCRAFTRQRIIPTKRLVNIVTGERRKPSRAREETLPSYFRYCPGGGG